MCGIIGSFGSRNDVDNVVRGLEILQNRGKDGFGILVDDTVKYSKNLKDFNSLKGNNILGHCLHAVVGSLNQPIDRFVINCEIYNWKELAEKFDFNVRNDAELVLELIKLKGVEETIKLLDGDYAFAYWYEDSIYLARDLLGVKSIWYNLENGFCFASEKRVFFGTELNPRSILKYNLKTKNVEFIRRDFLSLEPKITESYEDIKKKVKGLIVNAISKRIPDSKFGILFSGGVDSTLIALICKELGVDFTCYLAVLDEDSMSEAEDLTYALKVAKEYDFDLKIKKLKVSEIEDYLRKIVPLVCDPNVVKTEVALTIYVATEMCKEKVIFSGVGSEDVFGGYNRHKQSIDINNECYSGLLKIYERDLSRDDIITMNQGVELRVPYLDLELVRYCLRISDEYKISNDITKKVLRDIAFSMGLKEEFAYRKKRAAQYGSKFDRALTKLSRNYESKALYLKQFYSGPLTRLGCLFSSGKDSTYALYTIMKQNYDVKCLITVKSKNDDSFMFHTPNINLVDYQSECIGLPLVSAFTEGVEEEELDDLKNVLIEAKEKYNIEGIITGALFSNYQRLRIERICDALNLKVFNPLWHKPQNHVIKELLDLKFDVIISSIAADGLDESWLGLKIDYNVLDRLNKLNEKFGLNVAFEGGEAESCVLDCPLFSKKISIVKAHKVMTGSNSGRFIIDEVKLINK